MDPQDPLQRQRHRWNESIRAVGFALWIIPMSQFWMRFFPPLRPFDFHAAAPPWSFWILALLCCTTPFAVPRHWFRPLWFENRKLYERLGIRLFRQAAPDGDWVNRSLRGRNAGYRFIRHRTDLDQHLIEGIAGERTHIAFLSGGLLTTAYAWSLGESVSAIALSVGNVAFNLFPVLLQRYKRVRTSRHKVLT
jgi:hypothetical protein